MRRHRLRSFGAAWVVVGVALASASCSLLVDTSGLSGGGDLVDAGPAASDAAPADAVTVDAVSDGGGADTGADASDGSAGPCPSVRGPAMVLVADTNGSFCVDATEVSEREFNRFLAEPKANLPAAPAACSSKTSFGGTTRPDDDLPVMNVDWCDAWMFCAWAGKRLCGSRNGTPIDDFPPANDPKISEWFAACSRSGARKYPYGASFAPTACNGCARTGSCDGGASAPVPVGSLAGCEGGYAGIFDMSGNVAEWEDNCGGDTCPPRGGGRSGPFDAPACEIQTIAPVSTRAASSDDIGIRCCATKAK